MYDRERRMMAQLSRFVRQHNVVVGEGERAMKRLWSPIVGVAVLIALSTVSLAHHIVGHNVFEIGVQTRIKLELGACDTLDKANTIMDAHVESGFLVAKKP